MTHVETRAQRNYRIRARLLAPVHHVANLIMTANPGFWLIMAGLGLMSFAATFLLATWFHL